MQTLYLKLYYTAEFYAVNLSMEKDKSMFSQYISDAIRKGISVTEPDIFKSQFNFVATDEHTIVCGFNLLKGFGEKAYEELLSVRKEMKDENRTFETIIDFIIYGGWKKMNKKCFEVLAKSGALKSLEPNTRIVIELLEYHTNNKKNLGKVDKKTKEEKYSRDILQKYYDILKEKNMMDYTESEYNHLWNSVTGFNNPFNNRFQKYVETFSKVNVVGISAWKEEFPYVYGEIITREDLFTKNDKPYHRVKLSDGFLEKNVVVWGNQVKNNLLMKDKGLEVGNLICIELTKDDFGFKYKQNGKFFILEK